jgi:hypothetical protein
MLNNGWTVSLDKTVLIHLQLGMWVHRAFLSSPGVYNKVFVQDVSTGPSFLVVETNTGTARGFLSAEGAERFLLAISDNYRMNLAVDVAVQDPEFASATIAKSCSCQMFDLMNHGCKCGSMDFERTKGDNK